MLTRVLSLTRARPSSSTMDASALSSLRQPYPGEADAINHTISLISMPPQTPVDVSKFHQASNDPSLSVSRSLSTIKPPPPSEGRAGGVGAEANGSGHTVQAANKPRLRRARSHRSNPV